MFGFNYYHATFKKAMSAFGTLFNDITIVRRDANGVEVEREKVPLAYGPRDRYLIREKDDKDLQRQVAIKLPRLSFEMTGISYNPTRKLNTIQKNTFDVGETRQIIFNPVPYDISVTLNVLCKTMDEANQIVEQILPWFTPSYTITIESLPEMQLKDDLIVQLNNTSLEENYEANSASGWLERQEVLWTFDFTIKTFFYGPIRSQGIIKKSQVDYLIPEGELSDEIISQTPRLARSSIEPQPEDANLPENAFGFSETYEEFNDGLKYNPETGEDEEI
jgi:hypothetical protein